MSNLSDCLRCYIFHRMNTNPAWRTLKVILSDANVPGEGEHKVIGFIRQQRSQLNYDRNTHHIVCGSDSDLILLGLATHEHNFTILHEANQHIESSATTSNNNEKKYIFVDLKILRTSLEGDLKIYNFSPFRCHSERALDDYLPKLPSIDKPKYSMKPIMCMYKETVREVKEYLTENGIVNIKCVQILLRNIGKDEENIVHYRDERNRKRDLYRNNAIQFWGEGWHERYYKEKFKVSQNNFNEFCTEVAGHYVRGLCWILEYYYRGVPSWNWYVIYIRTYKVV